MNFSNLFLNGWKYALVNLLTLSRILICPVILLLVFTSHFSLLTSYMLLFAFFTDALDGFLARKLKVTSEQGTKLDSLADDCLFITAIITAIYLKNPVLLANGISILLLLIQYAAKIVVLWKFHRKIFCGLHTYLNKLAAFFQAAFFIHSLFFLPNATLFYFALSITSAAISEEIILIITQKELKQNFKGMFFKSTKNESVRTYETTVHD